MLSFGPLFCDLLFSHMHLKPVEVCCFWKSGPIKRDKLSCGREMNNNSCQKLTHVRVMFAKSFGMRLCSADKMSRLFNIETVRRLAWQHWQNGSRISGPFIILMDCVLNFSYCALRSLILTACLDFLVF